MPPLGIVQPHRLGQASLELGSDFEMEQAEAFVFEGADQALGLGIVIAAIGSHAGQDAVLSQ